MGNSGDSARVKVAAKSIYGILDRESKIDPTDPNGLKEGIEGEIEFRDVCFRYPSRPNILVLRNFSAKFPKGQKVALVGPSGCGKSTIIGLLQRYYEPGIITSNLESGEIIIDGRNIKEYNISYLRKCVII